MKISNNATIPRGPEKLKGCMKPFRDRRKVFLFFKQDPQNNFEHYEKK